MRRMRSTTERFLTFTKSFIFSLLLRRVNLVMTPVDSFFETFPPLGLISSIKLYVTPLFSITNGALGEERRLLMRYDLPTWLSP